MSQNPQMILKTNHIKNSIKTPNPCMHHIEKPHQHNAAQRLGPWGKDTNYYTNISTKYRPEIQIYSAENQAYQNSLLQE